MSQKLIYLYKARICYAGVTEDTAVVVPKCDAELCPKYRVEAYNGNFDDIRHLCNIDFRWLQDKDWDEGALFPRWCRLLPYGEYVDAVKQKYIDAVKQVGVGNS